MNRADREFHADQLRGNQQTCNVIAERVDCYPENGRSVAAANITKAILALAEAVRILTRVQMYQNRE